jgi:NAD(P)-dependent dehydrogenase (short-subunit alcohol dehydrogenase family)
VFPRRAPPPALFVQADLSTAEGVEQLARAVLDRLGSVDILVNTLGGSSSPAGSVLDDIARVAISLASSVAAPGADPRGCHSQTKRGKP